MGDNPHANHEGLMRLIEGLQEAWFVCASLLGMGRCHEQAQCNNTSDEG